MQKRVERVEDEDKVEGQRVGRLDGGEKEKWMEAREQSESVGHEGKSVDEIWKELDEEMEAFDAMDVSEDSLRSSDSYEGRDGRMVL